MTCPACGANVTGNFCAECGTALAARQCVKCQATLSPGAKFCHRCGHAVDRGAQPGSATPWYVALTIIALSVGAILYVVLVKRPEAVRPDMANTGAPASGSAGARPPDISQMSPDERFIRLNDRVMNAIEQGDSATASRFLPMALAAYGQLDRSDIDLRYHAAILHVAAGDLPEAAALADSITAEAKDHLFGSMIRAAVAEAKGDKAGIAKAHQAFLSHYDAEIAQNRPEYQEHKAALEEFHRQASQTP
jgi:hypothetical protein